MAKDTSMSGSVGWGALALAVLVPACSMLKKAGPAGAGDGGELEAGVAEVEAAGPALAANEADVTRYPDEKVTAGSILTTEAPADLRTEVGAGGRLVVVLKKGTEVAKVAEHASHYLVVGEDPKDATRKLMGWAGEGAFGGAYHGVAPMHAGDGGLMAATDGGHASSDAGGGGAAGFSCVKQEKGACPAGFKVSAAVCRMTCKLPTDCKGPEPKCNDGLCYASNGCP